jgi:hypothetical protein
VFLFIMASVSQPVHSLIFLIFVTLFVPHALADMQRNTLLWSFANKVRMPPYLKALAHHTIQSDTLIACAPVVLTVSGGEPPYYMTAVEVDGAVTVRELEAHGDSEWTWVVDHHAGTPLPHLLDFT